MRPEKRQFEELVELCAWFEWQRKRAGFNSTLRRCAVDIRWAPAVKCAVAMLTWLKVRIQESARRGNKQEEL